MTLIPDPARQGASNRRLRLNTLAAVTVAGLIAAAYFAAGNLLDRRLERETGRIQARIAETLPGYLAEAPHELHPSMNALAQLASRETTGFYAAACALAVLDLAARGGATTDEDRVLLEYLARLLHANPAPTQREAMAFAESYPRLRAALAAYAPPSESARDAL